jgi:translation initiation factor 1
MEDSRLVYSTETGRVCPGCQKSAAKCTCKKKKPRAQTNIKLDGKIRIRREKKGRKGKTVTTVSGFQLNEIELKDIAAQLKRKCGTGGSVKDGIIVIQGDHREALQAEFEKLGYTAILAGGPD